MTRVSTCIHHPDREATTRCKQCHKPLCKECRVVSAEGVFCSESCRKELVAFQERTKNIEQRKFIGKRGIPGLIKLLIFLGIIAAIAHFAFGIDILGTLKSWLSNLKGIR